MEFGLLTERELEQILGGSAKPKRSCKTPRPKSVPTQLRIISLSGAVVRRHPRDAAGRDLLRLLPFFG